ncbi:MAG: hypothetical protein JW955_05630 [Sedimentisphaerales bacterium]|nr:hypothetical protein [Sedimentisphaerales bacterium]
MMRDGRILFLWLAGAMLSATALGADLFPTEIRRQAFLKALRECDARYDAKEQMLQAPFSSPGYHTTLTGGTVHPTRESFEYAVALLDSGEPERQERAEAVLRRLISLQDQDPNSRTYGIWSWFLEEPLDRMSPPDWNWADFCGTQLLQVAIDHMNRLSLDLQEKVRDSILHAARSIRRRNVGPDYTNIALMGTYVTLVAGERLDDLALLNYGRTRLARFSRYTQEKGSFSEYNSPTYTCVAIAEISRMIQHVRDAESQQLLERLNDFAWLHMARRFHPPTRQWAGPHSRCYSTLLPPTTLGFLQRATEGRFPLVPEADAWQSITAQRIALRCPTMYDEYFTSLPYPRAEVETFVHNAPGEHDIVGTTYLHPDFTLGSVNLGDCWNQRRPLIAYAKTPAGVVAMRLRFLHDDYDYSSASLFAVQDMAGVLGAVLFATDRGDTHISLDKIRNGTILARDLRLRLQFEGAVGDLKLPALPKPGRLEVREPVRATCGSIGVTWCLHFAGFAGLALPAEVGRDSETAWIDLILYHGRQREFNFNEIKEAAIVFTLSLTPSATAFDDVVPSVYASVATDWVAGVPVASPRQTWSWQRTNESTLSLTIPLKPLPTNQQKAAAEARSGSTDPWKTAP